MNTVGKVGESRFQNYKISMFQKSGQNFTNVMQLENIGYICLCA
jgi:hypothetical protein